MGYSSFKVWKHYAKSITKNQSQLNASEPCYYFHKDHISIAVVNFSHKHGWVSDTVLNTNHLKSFFLNVIFSLYLSMIKETKRKYIFFLSRKESLF